MPRRPVGSGLSRLGPFAVLAESDFEEHQQQRPAEPDRYQGDGQCVPDHSGHQDAAEGTGDDQRGGQPKGQRP